MIFGLFLIISLSRSVWELYGKKDIFDNTEIRLQKVREENQVLQKQLAEVTSPGYVEKQAREKLNLAKAGEVIVILPEVTPALEAKPARELANWQKWLNLFR